MKLIYEINTNNLILKIRNKVRDTKQLCKFTQLSNGRALIWTKLARSQNASLNFELHKTLKTSLSWLCEFKQFIQSHWLMFVYFVGWLVCLSILEKQYNIIDQAQSDSGVTLPVSEFWVLLLFEWPCLKYLNSLFLSSSLLKWGLIITHYIIELCKGEIFNIF